MNTPSQPTNVVMPPSPVDLGSRSRSIGSGMQYDAGRRAHVERPLRDIYEAAEKLTATMAMSVEQLARERGWASRTLSGMLVEPRLMMLYSATVLLPYGRGASFVPARAPRTSDIWMIDIRRSDGVSRPTWNQGITIKKQGGVYALLVGGEALDPDGLMRLLDAIGTP